MLKPKQNTFIYRFFSWYINRLIKKDFKEFNYNRVEIDIDKAVLVLSNHFSWWDGFLIFQLNRLVVKKKFYVMVSEENYNKIGFLKHMGAFSIGRNSKDVLNSLKFAGELLNNPGNLLLIFPQGKLFSNHVCEIEFQKGLSKIVEHSNKTFQYLFVSMFFDYFQHRNPTITAYLKKQNCIKTDNSPDISTIYNLHHQDSLTTQIARVI